MNKLSYLSLFAFIIALASCGGGDEHLIDKDAATLKQFVFAGPDGSNGDIANYYDPVDEIFVEQGQTIKFFAGYSIGQRIYTDETLQQYYNGLLWKIEENTYNLNSFRHTFSTPGEFEGTLETTDTFGDTLRTTFKIHVNTPNSIVLESPENGFNQASPYDDQELTLQWKVSGIDPWEKPQCIIYMDYDPDSVWTSPLGYANCNESAILMGSLIQTYDSTAIAEQEISAYDSSFTLYWGAKLIVKSESGRIYYDSTEVFHFSTRILEETAALRIPFVFDHLNDNSTLHTDVYLIAENGDTLKKFENFFTANTIVTKIEPQDGLKIVMKEDYRKEFASESLVVDVPAYTVLTTDTIVLKDNTPPQIDVINDQVLNSDSIVFYVYDDGSGINVSKLQVIMDFDTLSFNYLKPFLKFNKTCIGICKLTISGEDYARNSLPNIYWKIENIPGYRVISGPYLNEDF